MNNLELKLHISPNNYKSYFFYYKDKLSAENFLKNILNEYLNKEIEFNRKLSTHIKKGQMLVLERSSNNFLWRNKWEKHIFHTPVKYLKEDFILGNVKFLFTDFFDIIDGKMVMKNFEVRNFE